MCFIQIYNIKNIFMLCCTHTHLGQLVLIISPLLLGGNKLWTVD